MQTERAYEVLGLAQGASFREVMEAHRDLVQVWDPKRFHENFRLQRRAIQELALLNEAFDTLRICAMKGQIPEALPAEDTHEPPPAPSEAPWQDSAFTESVPRALPRASLYDMVLPKRGKQRFLTWLPLITGVIMAAVVVAWILFSDSGNNIDEQPSDPAVSEAPAEAPTMPMDPTGMPESTAPSASDSNAGVTDGAAAASRESAPAADPKPTAPLVRQAFNLLREKSRTASQLLEKGRYDNLRFESSAPLHSVLHEFQLQVLAVREPQGDHVRLIWSVNLDTRTVSPLNDAARELDDREAGPKPQLIRRM
ncbi:MAG: J domain-containing protein [Acidobacteriota bacterium]